MIGTDGTTRFVLDENVDLETMLKFLDGEGLSCTELPERLWKATDDEVFEFAWQDERVLLTHDDDFLNDSLFPLERTHGIVVMPGGSGDVDRFLKVIGQTLHLMKPRPGLFLQTKIHIRANGDIIVRGVNATSKEPFGPFRMRFLENGTAEIWEE